jgi:hypothetical protein
MACFCLVFLRVFLMGLTGWLEERVRQDGGAGLTAFKSRSIGEQTEKLKHSPNGSHS